MSITTLRTEFSETVTVPMGPANDLIPIPGIATTIYNVNPDGTEGSQATAYADIVGATQAPSLVTDQSGYVSYFLDPGDYSIHFDDQQSPPRIQSYKRHFSSVPSTQTASLTALQATVSSLQASLAALQTTVGRRHIGKPSKGWPNVRAAISAVGYANGRADAGITWDDDNNFDVDGYWIAPAWCSYAWAACSCSWTNNNNALVNLQVYDFTANALTGETTSQYVPVAIAISGLNAAFPIQVTPGNSYAWRLKLISAGPISDPWNGDVFVAFQPFGNF